MDANDRELLERAAKALDHFGYTSSEDARVIGEARAVMREIRARLSTPAAEVLQATRPETGPMRFGTDWTGVFIRGDNAGYYAFTLDALLRGDFDRHSLQCAPLRGLLDDLRGSNDMAGRDRDGVQQLRPFGECLSTIDSLAGVGT